MNRRELLLGGVAVGVVTAFSVEQGFSKLLLDGVGGECTTVSDDCFNLWSGDWTLDMWFKWIKDETGKDCIQVIKTAVARE